MNTLHDVTRAILTKLEVALSGGGADVTAQEDGIGQIPVATVLALKVTYGSITFMITLESQHASIFLSTIHAYQTSNAYQHLIALNVMEVRHPVDLTNALIAWTGFALN